MKARMRTKLYGLLWRHLIKTHSTGLNGGIITIAGLGDVKDLYKHNGDLIIVIDGRGEL